MHWNYKLIPVLFWSERTFIDFIIPKQRPFRLAALHLAWFLPISKQSIIIVFTDKIKYQYISPKLKAPFSFKMGKLIIEINLEETDFWFILSKCEIIPDMSVAGISLKGQQAIIITSLFLQVLWSLKRPQIPERWKYYVPTMPRTILWTVRKTIRGLFAIQINFCAPVICHL